MNMDIGCHVSIAGGVQNAPERAHALGCEIMQIFTRAPQGGPAPVLTSEILASFQKNSERYEIKNTYIHTPYFINFASANNRIRYGSAKVVREELERGTSLGVRYVMTHLGSAKDLGETEAIKKTIQMLQEMLEGYEGTTELLLENSAGTGAIIGDNLGELAKIIDGVGNRYIAGICLDTQHSFASGYDWTDLDATLKRIDEEIGLDRVKLFHANDSQTQLNSRRDRHAHIGKGNIGLDAFRSIVSLAKKNDIDMVLETEHDEIKNDIETLKRLREEI